MFLHELHDLATLEIFFLLICAASGGIGRLVVQDYTCDSISCVVIAWEVLRLLFVALPVGIIAGLWTKYTFGNGNPNDMLPYAATFCAGVLSLSFVTFLSSPEGVYFIRSLILRMFGRNK